MTASIESSQVILQSTSSHEDFARNLPALAAIARGRDTVTTHEAAATLNRTQQTLRKWACLENGPIRPIRIFGRLAWKVSDLQALLSGGVK